MKVFEGTELPDDLFSRVQSYLEAQRRSGTDAVADAVFWILGRALAQEDKRAIVDALHAGRVPRLSIAAAQKIVTARR